MLYGYLTENYFPLISCFVYGECCAIVYLAVYIYYCTDKRFVIRVLVAVVTITAIITIYAIIGSLGYTGQTTSSVNTVMGVIAVCGGVCLYGAPMEKLLQVLQHKSAAFINVHMVIAGLTSNILWLTYGILITNWFIMSLNAFFLTVNVFTLYLYRIYDPKAHPLQDGWNAHPNSINSEDVEISVCIEVAETSVSKMPLSRLPTPVYSSLKSP